MSRNSISDEEKALFRKEMSLVTPLAKNKQQISVKKPPVVVTQKAQAIPKDSRYIQRDEMQNRPQHNLSDSYHDPVDSDTILSYTNHLIPNKRFKELKRGEITYEARLDLHGLKPDDASRALSAFIDAQTRINKRVLLIIHGKGGQDGKAPIIKNLVNHWLKQFPQILAFHSALPRDGGSGALYVLLKRNQSYEVY